MSEPPPAERSPAGEPGDIPVPPDAGPTGTPPRLLVLPPTDGLSPIVWPGAADQPAWAIPVTVPPGTRGYAIFLPLVAADDDPAATAPGTSAVAALATPPPAAATVSTPVGTTPPASPPTEPVSKAASPPAQRSPETAAPGQRAPGAAPSAVLPGAPVPPAPDYRVPGSPYDFRSRPLQPSFLDRAWPGPAPARDRATPLAVLAGALGVAAFVPLGRTGVGWFLGWLVLTAGVLVAVRRHTADLPRAQRWVRAGWAGAALALLAVLAFRNAWWLVTFCVIAALCCAALAIVGGRRIRSILFSLGAAPLAALRGLPWVRAHVRSTGEYGTTR
ncbi:DUF4153 domain-containing protein [Verrucosispora sp. TAA-831]|uniref:DUF4153 domain-containing protein n=1 Tax=Verrucosispora sp. TAA-831 TaxID=3422227 RepID=UPI003D6F1BC3